MESDLWKLIDMKSKKYNLKEVRVRLHRLPANPKPMEVRINRSIKHQLLQIYSKREISWKGDIETKIGKNFSVTVKPRRKVRCLSYAEEAEDQSIKVKNRTLVKKSVKSRKIQVRIPPPTEVEKIKDRLVRVENYQLPETEEEREEEDTDCPCWPVPTWARQEEVNKTMISRSQAIDPALLFAEQEAPDLDMIFTDQEDSGGRDIWRSPVSSPVK